MKQRPWLFLLISFFLWFPHFLYVPILSTYLIFLDASYRVVGLILGGYGLMQFFFRIPIGVLSDYFSLRKSFIVLAMLLNLCSCLLYTVSIDPIVIGIARLLAGISASFWGIFTITYANCFDYKQLSKAMGQLSFVLVCAQFSGMILGGIVVNQFGWNVLFLIGLIISVIGLIITSFISIKSTYTTRKVTKKVFSSILKNRYLWYISLLSILAHAIIFSTIFGYTSDIALQKGMVKSMLWLIVTAFMLPHACIALCYDRFFVQKMGVEKTLFLSFNSVVCMMVLMPIVQQLWLFMLIQMILGAALGIIFPLLLSESISNIEESFRGMAIGVYQSIYAIGITLGPIIVGNTIDFFDSQAGMIVTAIFGIIASCFIGMKIIKSRRGDVVENE